MAFVALLLKKESLAGLMVLMVGRLQGWELVAVVGSRPGMASEPLQKLERALVEKLQDRPTMAVQHL